MENTLFEHTVEFNEETYRAVWQHKSRRWLYFAIVFAIGFFMLFWSYTLLLGVLFLILCFLKLVSPGILSKGLHHNFRGQRYLHQPLRYGVSVEHLWVQGETIDAKASWSLVVTWQIKRDWLILTPSGIPPVHLPVSEMKKSGVYDQIMQLAKKNGREFK